jgi:olfactory receptor
VVVSLHSLVQLAFVVNLSFCGANVLDSFYCDLLQFIKLACIDTYQLEFMVTVNSGFLSMGSFFTLIISYVFIMFTIQNTLQLVTLILWSFDIHLYMAFPLHMSG